MGAHTKVPSSGPHPTHFRRSTRSLRRSRDSTRPAALATHSEQPGSPKKKRRNSYATATPIYDQNGDNEPIPDVVRIADSPAHDTSREAFESKLESEPPQYQRSGHLSNSPELGHESFDSLVLGRPGSPNKKQRNTIKTHTAKCNWQEVDRKLVEGENLTQREEFSLDSSPELSETDWEKKWIAQAKELSRQEVALETTFEPSSKSRPYVGASVITSLSAMQEYHRRNCNESPDSLFKTKPEFQKPEYARMRERLQARTKELLARDWEKSSAHILSAFKDSLLCKHCDQVHKIENSNNELDKKAEELKMILEKMDPRTINQDMLGQIDYEARKMGEEYLRKIDGTNCQGTRIVWQKQVKEQKERERSDSGIDMATSKFAALEIKIGGELHV